MKSHVGDRCVTSLVCHGKVCDEFSVSREETAGKLCKVGEMVHKAELLHEGSRSRGDRMRTHGGAN